MGLTVVLGVASVAGFAVRALFCWWCMDPAFRAWVLVLFCACYVTPHEVGGICLVLPPGDGRARLQAGQGMSQSSRLGWRARAARGLGT
jgi:hypothetical protein